MELSELTLQSIKNYLAVLKRAGSVQKSQVYKLLVLSFIDDLFSVEQDILLSNKECGILLGIVDCLGRSTCLIPFSHIPKDIEAVKTISSEVPFSNEDTSDFSGIENSILNFVN